MAGTKKRSSGKRSTARRSSSKAIVVARPTSSLDGFFGGSGINLDIGLSGVKGLGLGNNLYWGSDPYARSMIMPQLLEAKLMEQKFAMAVKKAQLKGALGMKEWQMQREIKAQEAAINAVSDMVRRRQANYEEARKADNNPYLAYLRELKSGISNALEPDRRNAGTDVPVGLDPPAAGGFTDYNGYGGGYDAFTDYGGGDLDLFSGQYY